jgi:hypothetical protein
VDPLVHISQQAKVVSVSLSHERDSTVETMADQPSLVPCIICDKSDCGATLIVPRLASEKKRFNRTTNCLTVMCPACGRLFSVSIFKLEWLEVEEADLKRGFWGAKRAHRWSLF